MIADGAIDDIAFTVVDEDVWSFSDQFAVQEAAVKSGFAAAIADSFDFFDFVSDLEETSGAFETFIVLAEIQA